MSKSGFIELCARTHYSLLQGASSPREMVDRAQALGMSSIGIADRNGVYSIPKAFEAWKAHEQSGFKLIVGGELSLDLADDVQEAPPATVIRGGTPPRAQAAVGGSASGAGRKPRIWHLRL